MTTSIFHPSQTYPKPVGFCDGEYTNADGLGIRYGFLKSPNEKAVVVHQSGQSHFLELEYENAADLAARGISFYTVERTGDGGSQRHHDDPQKPPSVDHVTYVRDLHQFMGESGLLSASVPKLLIGQCLGGGANCAEISVAT